MRRPSLALAAALLALPAALALVATAATAGAAGFTIVNGTGANMVAVAIRRFGTQEWTPLGVAPPAGAQGVVDFRDDDCAFDIQAELAGGGKSVWQGVNLCEAKQVRLNRDAQGALWVDYD
jgi:hypothetical protein